MPKKKSPAVRAMEQASAGAGSGEKFFDSATYEVKKQQMTPEERKKLLDQAVRAPHVVSGAAGRPPVAP